MPHYVFQCSMNHETEEVLSFKQFDELQQIDGVRLIKCACGLPAFRQLQVTNFNLNYRGGSRH